MRTHRFIAGTFLSLFIALSAQAEQWETYFAYNNVTQIAMAPDEVFAISDGSLFSVNKQSEHITKYDRQSGLNGTNIKCIYYDATGNQLIITYENGKIDLLTANGVRYISDLYDKDMTQRKDIYNVTIQGRTAYFSTHYGVQTMDLRENKLVDSYWLRPGGQETPIQDVRIIGDSIYAFGGSYDKANKKVIVDSLFVGAKSDNLSDYTYWKREKYTGRVTPDATKGKQYIDGDNTWSAGGSVGITRVTTTETINYKPEGPLVNKPYRLTATKDGIWVVPGGRWGVQYNTPGVVMHYNGTHWVNINDSYLQSKTGMLALDFMNVAVDPRNKNHYYVTSYGTGLYEFDHDTLVRHDIADLSKNTLQSAAPAYPQRYTRLDFATYDNEGNLWIMDASAQKALQCIDNTKTWHGVSFVINSDTFPVHTPGGLIIDKLNPNLKWTSAARYNTGVCLFDDNGTRFDMSDDHFIHKISWVNQHGRPFTPFEIHAMMQDQIGRIWICTEIGVAYFETGNDFFTSDAVVQPDIIDDNGENPLTSLTIKAICQTPNGNIWIGTDNLGIYILNNAATEIVGQYTTENSAMPSNNILALAYDGNGKVWIGTDGGLVSVDQSTTPTNDQNENKADDENNLDNGDMQQWRLHLSYSNAIEAAASPKHIYAVANGSLFSFDRADETLQYWSRATGLNGTTIEHIAYDATSGYLVVAYTDGRIDLIDEKGNVKQMPDLYLKAGSMPMTSNSLTVGSKYTYLSMPFGIVAINTKKGEVTDTYYIGTDAAAVNVLRVIEKGDSLYAFTSDRIYSAALKDNLVDYSFWHQSAITTDRLQEAILHKDIIYTLQHDSLYRLDGDTWQLVSGQPITWIHESGGQLLLCINKNSLYRLTDDQQLSGLSNTYHLNDAIYSQGEYWLCETNYGLIRLNKDGDDYYHTSGPNSNSGYFMCTAHGQLYTAIGGRWAVEYNNPTDINIFTGKDWINRDYMHIISKLNVLTTDPSSIAVDPLDPGHFFVAMYSNGVVEFRNYEAFKQHSYYNSTIRPVNSTIDKDFYTRVDGVMMDESSNLWVMNATQIGQPLHVMTPNGIWHPLKLRNNGTDIYFATPSGIWIDRRNPHHKWMMDQRYSQCVILLDDKGSPTDDSDDKCIARSTFVDQNGNMLAPSTFRCFAQDKTNRIWIGTEKGIILIPESVDFFKSNACRRIIIPRNDGSGLGDYLLGEEQINCMAVDGGNRVWIGTASSGLYLIEDDTITVAHFTETNSILPSNEILSIAIMSETGEVFVGTSRGIASYRSDASEPRSNLSTAYAYPNPVRPNYVGMITITGLMENTVVNIVDAGGNLVCKTKSHGGTAVWDGRDAYGRRATAGVYTAFCNEPNGGHVVVKIFIIR